MIVAALLIGCNRSPQWTDEGALAPVLVAMDSRGDGRVDAADWEATRWEGPAFTEVDTDGDGALSTGELSRAIWSQDPLRFDDPEATRAAPDDATQVEYFPVPWEARSTRDALSFLVAEVRSVDPAAAVPSRGAIVLAATAGGPESDGVLALRWSLREAFEAAGLPLPALLATAP